MSRETPRNLAASVRQRLFNRAQERHEDFGLVLTKYGLERFLYRLAHSQYQDQFVLKALDIDVDIVVGKVIQLECDDEILELGFLFDAKGAVEFVERAGFRVGRPRAQTEISRCDW